jgi:hypothetical protein
VAERDSVKIVLTPEQQALLKRLSGQDVDALEIETGESKEAGGAVGFRWRLSASSGIPRQAWASDEGGPTGQPKG